MDEKRSLCVFEQGEQYTVHLRLIGKLVADFLFELFSLAVTAEALRANIDLNSTFLKGAGQFRPNFHVDANRFCTAREVSECLTINFVTVFKQRNFVADFLQIMCTFNGKWTFFEPPLGAGQCRLFMLCSFESA